MKFTLKIINLSLLLCISGLLFSSFSQTLTGKIIDEKSVAIKGALVNLAMAGLSDTSMDDGAWSITVPTAIEPIVRKWLLPAPILKGAFLYFAIIDKAEQVKIGIYALSGRLMDYVVNQKCAAGFYSVNLLDHSLPPTIYAVQFQIGNKTTYFKLLMTEKLDRTGVSRVNKTNPATTGRLEKRMVVIDTVKVSKPGYDPAAVPISSYTSGPLTIILKTYIPAYHLNPPNPCYNKFVVDSCVPGDTNSACRGNCRVANACSPPEDQSKSNLPKTFACPRFMLYSTEMLQAAKDDAALYGWGDTGAAPFNYAVVGHDPDVGGVDDQQSSCCQCYQIIYVKPEPSSPQPPDLPYPKSLVVQSFNTAASGAKGFDVFMAAGGYGAFNACYKDAAFGSTTKFNEFIYDKFPYQNPGSGGISFLRYQDCIKGWPPTVDGVLSSACQDIIKQMCDQALVNSSTEITEYTRNSCIQTNQLASLYHQNWDVMVKRVRCPDNLTRVTGCRLKEEKLPLPSPKVQTPTDAKADGTFRDGYHTTTMQDCCKPTCAWTDWTVGRKLPVDGEWNSFYSCDKNGKPITK
jgi:hypothetical protein